MKKTEIKTITYILTGYDDFMIDIVEDEENRSAWIYRNSYGTKSLMWGEEKTQSTFEEFLEMVEANAPDYIDEYDELVDYPN